MKNLMTTRFLPRMKAGALLFAFQMLFAGIQANAQSTVDAGKALIGRVVPAHAKHFEVAELMSVSGKDEFEIENVDGKILLRGTSGVAVASGGSGSKGLVGPFRSAGSEEESCQGPCGWNVADTLSGLRAIFMPAY